MQCMCECINEGLYHPNCQDSHTTYFGGILDDDEEPQDEQGEQEEPDTGNEQEPINEQSKPAEQPFTPEEQQLNEQLYNAQQRENYCERQTERFERLSKYSLDEGNVREYKARAREWEQKLSQTEETVSELQEKIKLNEEKQVIRQTANEIKKQSVVNTMIGKPNIANEIQRFAHILDDSEENEEKTVANLGNKQVSYIDVTDEYLSNATPEVGIITRDRDYKEEKHKEEVDFAEWLHRTLGGTIHMYQEHTGKKYPDYLWNGKLWDLKSVTTERAANNAVKSGHKQIKENPGGIMINFGDNAFVMKQLEKEIEDRMKWYHDVKFDIMIVYKGKIVKVLRYKK